MKRALSPSLNAPGFMAAAGAVYAAVAMLYNAHYHHGIINPSIIVAAVGAVASLLARTVVTPTADPKNGAGVPLVPAPAPVPPLDHPPAGNL